MNNLINNTPNKTNKRPQIFNASALLNSSFANAIPVIHGLLQERQILLFTGPSKSGKSFLLLQLAHCLSAGKSFLNCFPCASKKVLYVDLENGAAEMKSRLAAQCRTLNWGSYATNNLNFIFHNEFIQDIESFADGVIADAMSIGAEVIIIDPLYMLFNGEESSSAVVTELVKNLKRIVLETNTNLIVCHHHTKGTGDKNTINRGAGSSVLGRAVDAAIDISPIFKKLNLGKYADGAKAYTMSFSLRHFQSPADKTMVFDYPLFVLDPSIMPKKKSSTQKVNPAEVRNTFQKVNQRDGVVKVSTLSTELGFNERRLRDLLKTDLKEILTNNRGTLCLKEDSDNL